MSEIEAGLADGVLEPLARLLGEMRAAGIQDPASVVRAALEGGEAAVKWPLFAWGAGINPVAVMWAREVRVVLVVADHVGDLEATARAIDMALDLVALDRALAM
jgi:hypothetical protein